MCTSKSLKPAPKQGPFQNGAPAKGDASGLARSLVSPISFVFLYLYPKHIIMFHVHISDSSEKNLMISDTIKIDITMYLMSFMDIYLRVR